MDRIQIEREARNCIAKGEWEKAISLYRELLEKRANDPNIYNLIGDVYAKMGNVSDALPEYMKTIELYADEGLYENGIAVCKKILRISPESYEVYFSLAKFYAEIGLLNEALDSLMKYAEGAKNKKEIEKKPQDYQKIITIIASDSRLKPKVKEIYLNLNKRTKELDVILGIPIETEEKTEEIEPKKETIIFEEDNLSHKEKTIEKVEPEIKPFISTKLDERKQEEVKYQITSRPTSFTKSKEEIEEVKPSEVEIPSKETILSQEKQSKLEEKIEEVKSKKEITDKDVEFFLHAIEKIKASDIKEEVQKDHYKLGIEYKNFGFYDAAIKEFQLCVATNTQKLKALRELGYCFLEKKEPKLAINAFNRALEEGGKSTSEFLALQYGIGLSYELLNKKEEAIKAFEQVYVRNVDYKEVQEKLQKLKGY